MTDPHLADWFAYTDWANERVLTAVVALHRQAGATAAGDVQEVAWSTLRGVLAHIVSVEWIWLQRWRGAGPAQPPAWAATIPLPELPQVHADLMRERNGHLATLSASALDAPCPFTLFNGKPAAFPLRDLFLHVVHHGTYHRGQIPALVRQLGGTPTPTDYLLFRSR